MFYHIEKWRTDFNIGLFIAAEIENHYKTTERLFYIFIDIKITNAYNRYV